MAKRCKKCENYEAIRLDNLPKDNIHDFGKCIVAIPLSCDCNYNQIVKGATRAKHCKYYKKNKFL